MVMIDGPIPDAVNEMYIIKKKIENALNSYINWVSNADNKLQDMDDDKIKLLRPILDKLSRGMYSITKDFYWSSEELSPYTSEKGFKIDAIKSVANAFHLNEYSDFFNNENDDLEYLILTNLKGADILVDAFDDYIGLDEVDKEGIKDLADNVLMGIYEATKGVDMSGKYIGDKYLSDLEYIVNIFGSDGEVQVVEN